MNPTILLAFSLHLPQGKPVRVPDRWFAEDKVKHFVSGVFAQSLGYGTIRIAGGSNKQALIGATAGTAGIAAWKELVYDRSGKGDPSIKDFTWTVAGGGAISVLLAQTSR